MRRRLSILIPITLLALTPFIAGSSAGAATQIGPVVNASGDHVTNNEITIALNPTNPDNVITGWNDWNRNEGCGTSRSTNGGRTWSPYSFIPGITRYDNSGNTYPGNGIYDFAGDPAVTFGADGTAYFACYGYLYANAAAPKGGVALFVSRSSDGGLTWGRPTQLMTSDANGLARGVNRGSNGQFPDHEAITADTWPGSPYNGSIYVAQAQFHGNGPSPITFWYSRNGRTWSSMITVSTNSLSSNQDAIPFVGPDGAVYVSFDNYERGSGVETIQIAKSTDGGATFAAPVTVATMVDPVDRDLVNSDYRAASYPAPGIDAQNRVTIAWNDRRSDGHSNMWYTRAYGSDLTSWTAPAQIKAVPKEQFFPWVHSAPGGRVDVVFYDRTRDPSNTLNYVTYSQLVPTGATGLGVTVRNFGDWSPAFNGNLDGGQTTTSCGPFIGDYIGLASDDSHVYLGWTGNGPSWHYDEFGNPVTCDVNEDVLTTSIRP